MAEKKVAKKPAKKPAPKKPTKQEVALAAAKQSATTSTKFFRKYHPIFSLMSIVYLVVLVWWEWGIWPSLPVWNPPLVGENNIIGQHATFTGNYWHHLWPVLIAALLLVMFIANLWAMRKASWRKAITWLNIAVLIAVGVFYQASTSYFTDQNSSMNAQMSEPRPPKTIADNLMQISDCTDTISTVANYTYSTATFYDMKQAGWVLDAVLSQSAANNGSFTSADCTKYLAIRAVYPASHIILQLYHKDSAGNLSPFHYGDFENSCYFNDVTSRTVCPDAPSYGIFVKN